MTCNITDGSKTVTYTPDTKYEEAIKESDSFAIPANKLFTGINTITVTAVDNAIDNVRVDILPLQGGFPGMLDGDCRADLPKA